MPSTVLGLCYFALGLFDFVLGLFCFVLGSLLLCTRALVTHALMPPLLESPCQKRPITVSKETYYSGLCANASTSRKSSVS